MDNQNAALSSASEDGLLKSTPKHNETKTRVFVLPPELLKGLRLENKISKINLPIKHGTLNVLNQIKTVKIKEPLKTEVLNYIETNKTKKNADDHIDTIHFKDSIETNKTIKNSTNNSLEEKNIKTPVCNKQFSFRSLKSTEKLTMKESDKNRRKTSESCNNITETKNVVKEKVEGKSNERIGINIGNFDGKLLKRESKPIATNENQTQINANNLDSSIEETGFKNKFLNMNHKNYSGKIEKLHTGNNNKSGDKIIDESFTECAMYTELKSSKIESEKLSNKVIPSTYEKNINSSIREKNEQANTNQVITNIRNSNVKSCDGDNDAIENNRFKDFTNTSSNDENQPTIENDLKLRESAIDQTSPNQNNFSIKSDSNHINEDPIPNSFVEETEIIEEIEYIYEEIIEIDDPVEYQEISNEIETFDVTNNSDYKTNEKLPSEKVNLEESTKINESSSKPNHVWGKSDDLSKVPTKEKEGKSINVYFNKKRKQNNNPTKLIESGIKKCTSVQDITVPFSKTHILTAGICKPADINVIITESISKCKILDNTPEIDSSKDNVVKIAKTFESIYKDNLEIEPLINMVNSISKEINLKENDHFLNKADKEFHSDNALITDFVGKENTKEKVSKKVNQVQEINKSNSEIACENSENVPITDFVGKEHTKEKISKTVNQTQEISKSNSEIACEKNQNSNIFIKSDDTIDVQRDINNMEKIKSSSIVNMENKILQGYSKEEYQTSEQDIQNENLLDVKESEKHIHVIHPCTLHEDNNSNEEEKIEEASCILNESTFENDSESINDFTGIIENSCADISDFSDDEGVDNISNTYIDLGESSSPLNSKLEDKKSCNKIKKLLLRKRNKSLNNLLFDKKTGIITRNRSKSLNLNLNDNLNTIGNNKNAILLERNTNKPNSILLNRMLMKTAEVEIDEKLENSSKLIDTTNFLHDNHQTESSCDAGSCKSNVDTSITEIEETDNNKVVKTNTDTQMSKQDIKNIDELNNDNNTENKQKSMLHTENSKNDFLISINLNNEVICSNVSSKVDLNQAEDMRNRNYEVQENQEDKLEIKPVSPIRDENSLNEDFNTDLSQIEERSLVPIQKKRRGRPQKSSHSKKHSANRCFYKHVEKLPASGKDNNDDDNNIQKEDKVCISRKSLRSRTMKAITQNDKPDERIINNSKPDDDAISEINLDTTVNKNNRSSVIGLKVLDTETFTEVHTQKKRKRRPPKVVQPIINKTLEKGSLEDCVHTSETVNSEEKIINDRKADDAISEINLVTTVNKNNGNSVVHSKVLDTETFTEVNIQKKKKGRPPKVVQPIINKTLEKDSIEDCVHTSETVKSEEKVINDRKADETISEINLDTTVNKNNGIYGSKVLDTETFTEVHIQKKKKGRPPKVVQPIINKTLEKDSIEDCVHTSETVKSEEKVNDRKADETISEINLDASVNKNNGNYVGSKVLDTETFTEVHIQKKKKGRPPKVVQPIINKTLEKDIIEDCVHTSETVKSEEKVINDRKADETISEINLDATVNKNNGNHGSKVLDTETFTEVHIQKKKKGRPPKVVQPIINMTLEKDSIEDCVYTSETVKSEEKVINDRKADETISEINLDTTLNKNNGNYVIHSKVLDTETFTEVNIQKKKKGRPPKVVQPIINETLEKDSIEDCVHTSETVKSAFNYKNLSNVEVNKIVDKVESLCTLPKRKRGMPTKVVAPPIIANNICNKDSKESQYKSIVKASINNSSGIRNENSLEKKDIADIFLRTRKRTRSVAFNARCKTDVKAGLKKDTSTHNEITSSLKSSSSSLRPMNMKDMVDGKGLSDESKSDDDENDDPPAKRRKCRFSVLESRKRGRPKGTQSKSKCDKDYLPYHHQIRRSSKNKSAKKISPEQSVKKMVKCGKCNVEMLKSQWQHHNLSLHNDLAWLEGTVKPNYENDEKLTKRVLFNAIKKRKGHLICELCNITKRSVLGFLSHLTFCGKDEKEKKALMVTCPVCKAVTKPSSLEYHERMHKMQAETKLKQAITEQDMNSGQKMKRKAAEKAVTKISEFTALVKDDKDKSDEKLKLNLGTVKKLIRKPQITKRIPNPALIKWNKDLNNGLKAVCSQVCCQFTSDSLDGIKEHYSMCNFTPQKNYVCKICKFQSSSKEEIVQHALQSHSLEDNEDENLSLSDTESSSSDNSIEKSDAKNQSLLRKSYKESSLKDSADPSFPMFKYLFKDACRTKYNKPFLPAFKWTLEFEQRNYDFNLFKDYMPNTFELLDIEKAKGYLPELDESMPMKTVKTINNKPVESEWKKWKRFEGNGSGSDEDNPTFFVGGPIWAMAWLPIPSSLAFSKGISQFMALSTHPSMDVEYSVGYSYSGKNIIQIWNLGDLNHDFTSNCNPELAYAITHEGGTVWCLEWCPSGYYEHKDLPGFVDENDKLRKMGLLAAACSDACIRIYSLIFPEDLPQSSENVSVNSDSKRCPIYNTEPVMILTLDTEAYQDKQQTWQVLKLSWCKDKGHNVIVGGLSNGHVALWDLTLKSPVFRSKRGNTVFLEPFNYFFAHHHAVTMVYLVPEGDKSFLATASTDRYYKFWDLNRTTTPLNTFKKSFVTNGAWLNNWGCAVISYDDALSMGHNYTCLLPQREYTYKYYNIFPTNSTNYGVDTSDFGNSIASGTLAGEVLAIFPTQLMYHSDMHKTLPRKRYYSIISSIDVIDLQVPADKQSLNNKKQDKTNETEYNYLPSTYNESKDRFGIKFHDKMNKFKEAFLATKKKSKRTLTCEMMQTVPIEQYPFMSANRVAWNPNAWSFLWLAVGYQSGFVRLIPFKSLALTAEWNKILTSHIDTLKSNNTKMEIISNDAS